MFGVGASLSALVAACRRRVAPAEKQPATASRRAANEAKPQPAEFEASQTYPWIPDQRDGTFRNPVLLADYSDPDVIRAGDEFYLTASSFAATPGLPILVSRDLVNWSLVGHALQNVPDPRYAEVQHGAGIWAPSLREHQGTFYLFAPTPDEGIYVLRAPHPRGPWSEPELLLGGKGLIDPCPLWDDDGKAYLVHAYARSRAGIKDRLRVRPMSPDATRVLGEGEIVYFDPERQPTLEGPKFYKRNGFYYILAPAGGVEKGWQLALRSRSVFGPYEARTVLEQGTSPVNGPHQGALVDTPSGEWWFLHFQDLGVYGRVVHLNPVTWQDDWPLMGEAGPSGKRQPVLRHEKPALPLQAIGTPDTSDEFTEKELGPAWQWHANHSKEWYSLVARPGHLRLVPVAVPGFDLLRAPNLLLQKIPARSFALETELELSETEEPVRAGLLVMGQSHAALAVQTRGAERGVALFIDGRSVFSARVPTGVVRLRLVFGTGGLCRFEYALPDGTHVRIPSRFQARKGRWIGAKVGIFALRSEAARAAAHADFDYFRFAPG
jgi:hypothetical protein